jgi:hypothetical protein
MSNHYADPAAAPFKTLPVTGDATSGVSALKTYTHAVDLNAAVDTSVNGVTFVGRGNTGDGGFGKTFTLAGATTPFSGDTTNVTGGIGATLSTFLYGTAGGNSSLTLDGLTPGTTYELSVFASSFGDPGGRFVTVSSENGSLVYDENFTGDNNGSVLTYLYTATGASQTFTFDPHDSDDTFHWYAFANAVAPVPEPGTASVLAAGAAAGLLRRRRPRRSRVH